MSGWRCDHRSYVVVHASSECSSPDEVPIGIKFRDKAVPVMPVSGPFHELINTRIEIGAALEVTPGVNIA